jgi:hypothetical protein
MRNLISYPYKPTGKIVVSGHEPRPRHKTEDTNVKRQYHDSANRIVLQDKLHVIHKKFAELPRNITWILTINTNV